MRQLLRLATIVALASAATPGAATTLSGKVTIRGTVAVKSTVPVTASARSSGPIPDATGTFGGSAAVIAYAIPVPSDATAFYVRLSNRTGISNGTGVNVTSNVAVYQSDGTGLPTGAALGSWTSQTVPGNGTELVLGPISVTRGTDGNVVVLYSIPAGVTYADARFQSWGAYVLGTTTVNPAPGGWTPNFTDGVLWITTEFTTAKRRIIVLGDSISVGAAPFEI